MRTLGQIRATNALDASRRRGMGVGQQGGDALSGFSTTILTDGFLAASALACERKQDRHGNAELKHGGEFLIVQAIAEHLHSLNVCKAQAPDALVAELAQANDATQLRRATAEAMEYLNYLKRFVA